MNLEAPVNAGHNFSNAAEDYEEREMWLKAAEYHNKAAEQFEIALKDTTDPEATKTLRLLTSNHIRKANELNRKAQRLNNKSAVNQRIQQMVGSHNNKSSTNGGGVGGSSGGGGLRHALPEKSQHNGLMVSRLANRSEYGESSHHRTSEIGESYALLSNENQEDDPFNKFLEAVEGLVDQLFNPAVAFTSAPLDENDNPIPIVYGPTQLKTEEESSGVSQQRQSESTQTSTVKPANMMDSYYIVPSPDGSDDPVHYQHRVNKPAIVTSNNEADKSEGQVGKEKHRLENEKLRAQVLQLKKRIGVLEQTAQEGNLLKSSVLQFRNDVHKQAKRIMQSHHESSMRSSAAALMGGGHQSNSIVGGSAARYPALAGGGGHDLISKLKELEAENKQLKSQHEKQSVLVNKYRERWEMLKENAKKRRASTISSPITEENET